MDTEAPDVTSMNGPDAGFGSASGASNAGLGSGIGSNGSGIGSSGTGGSRAQGLAGLAQTKLLGLADTGKHSVADSFGQVIGLVHEFADRFDGDATAPIANYLRDAVGILEGLQQDIRDRPVEDLIEDGRELVRRQPGIAVGAAMALGFVAARFVKAAAVDDRRDTQGWA